MMCSISFQVMAVKETGLQCPFGNWYYICCEPIVGKISGIVRVLESDVAIVQRRFENI